MTPAEQNPHYKINGHNGDVTPPLPAKKRHDPGNRSPPSPHPKVTRGNAFDSSREEKENNRRSWSLPNDFSPKFSLQRRGARKLSGPKDELGLPIINGHDCIDEGIAEER